MKKFFVLFIILFGLNLSGLYAQFHTTVQFESGQLRSHFTEEEVQSITHLTLTGSMNAIDFKVLRDEFTNLEFLDLTNVKIKLYMGKNGTFSDKTYVYPMDCIPAYAFRDKKSLKHVILSPSTKNLEDGAFLGCENLRICEIRKKKTPNLLKQALNDSITTVFVPLGSRDEYWKKDKWASFNLMDGEVISLEIEVTEPGSLETQIRKTTRIPEEVNFLTIKGTLNEEDFKKIRDNMPKLVGINITDITNDEIPVLCFSNKRFLMYLDLPAQLKSIGERAFSNCTRLSGDIILPETTQIVGEDTFAGCERVKRVILNNKEVAIR